jgi:hypothetical protein
VPAAHKERKLLDRLTVRLTQLLHTDRAKRGYAGTAALKDKRKPRFDPKDRF